MPLEPETVIVTESDCPVVMLEEAGVTVTVGVVGWLEELDPPPHAAIARHIPATGNSAK